MDSVHALKQLFCRLGYKVLGNSHVDLCILYQLHTINKICQCNRNMQNNWQHQWIAMDPTKFYQQRLRPYERRINRFWNFRWRRNWFFNVWLCTCSDREWFKLGSAHQHTKCTVLCKGVIVLYGMASTGWAGAMRCPGQANSPKHAHAVQELCCYRKATQGPALSKYQRQTPG